MTSSCPIHAVAIFYNLGVKNQARKLKFDMRDVHIELFDMYSGFLKILTILDFIITFWKKIQFFEILGVKYTFYAKSEIAILKLLSFCMLSLICIFL